MGLFENDASMGRGHSQRRPAIRRTCFVFVAVVRIGTKIVYVLVIEILRYLVEKKQLCASILCILSYYIFICDFPIVVHYLKKNRVFILGKFYSFSEFNYTCVIFMTH